MSKEEIIVTASKVKNAKYDEVVKEHLHNPKLIAPILKAIVPEYMNCTVDEVIQYIVKDSIQDDPVDDVSAIAHQLDTERSSVSEKLVKYDSRFKVINPKLSNKTISVFLHIDLEVQNNYRPTNPTYPIVKRAIYYGAREISSQLGILTEDTNYNDIEKAYSIWICNENIPKELHNTVTSYRITKNDEIGFSDEPASNYDLMNVIIVRRGNNEGTSEIFDYLTAFFTSDIDGICRHVDIRDDVEAVEGIKQMTGLGQSIYDKAYAEAYTEAYTEAYADAYTDACTKTTVNLLLSLVKDGLLSLSEAAKRASMSEEQFSELLKETN